MVSVTPFRAWYPSAEAIDEVCAPPWDVLTADEVRQLAQGKPHSILHVTRADALEGGEDAHAQGRRALDTLIRDGVLLRDGDNAYWAYRITRGAHSQLGLMAAVSSRDVLEGRVLKHEHTLAKKEDDRADLIAAHGACAEPVFYFCRDDEQLTDILRAASTQQPHLVNTDEEGVLHEMWRITGDQADTITRLFSEHDAIYVADGHHRSAGAARYYERRLREAGGTVPDGALWTHLLATIFPEKEVRILAYHRLIRDWGGLDAESLAKRISDAFTLTPAPDDDVPEDAVDLLVDGRWYRARVVPGSVPPDTPPESRLTLARLHDAILEPVLGIADPRRDDRLDFVGGIAHRNDLAHIAGQRGFTGAAWLPTVSATELRDVAEAGAVMPPKSTWFDPKLRSGMLLLPLEER